MIPSVRIQPSRPKREKWFITKLGTTGRSIQLRLCHLPVRNGFAFLQFLPSQLATPALQGIAMQRDG